MSDRTADRRPRGQWLVLGGVFVVVVALLGLGYFLFLRTDYVVLVQGLRPADASAVVAELDKEGRAYRLSDGGTTILVPEHEADATRIAIAGSDVAARGEIGFELFNKSDMGLTNFAQKINYQRALQGELVRTIMGMDGIESARVHLALPERTLFRGDRAEPKAAVTVTMKPGRTADPSQVAGIQRLVAAAVPDLPETAVVVLDGAGRVISPAVTAPAEEARSADLDEKRAVESYYRARARGAVERKLPGLQFQLRVLALPASGAPTSTAEGGWEPSGDGANRNFRVRFVFITEAGLSPEEQGVARDAIVQATATNFDAGDMLAFETGPLEAPVVAPPIAPAVAITPTVAPAPMRDLPTPEWPLAWIGGAAILLIGLLFALNWRSAGRTHLAPEDHEAFAARLRRQLNLTEDDADAVA